MAKIDNIELIVNERYSNIARKIEEGQFKSCCDSPSTTNQVPSLGCDKSLIEKAAPNPGEIVVDLGSGPGKDSIEIAKKVGPDGKVVGIDFSDDMLKLARINAKKYNIENAEFKKGRINDIPLKEESVDLVISNCVINLVEDKQSVFDEAYRILKKGGRLAISDMITDEIDDELMNPDLYCACVGGATSVDEYKKMLKNSGFVNIDTITEVDDVYNYLDFEIAYQAVLFLAEK